MTTRRVLSSSFTDPAGLPLYSAPFPVAGVMRRYAATSATGAVGADVASLTNQGSGTGALAAVGSGPTLREGGGRRYLEFDGAADLMTAAATDTAVGTGPITVYSVARFRTSPAPSNYYSLFRHSGAGQIALNMDMAGALVAYRTSSFTGASPASPGTTWHVFVAVFNGASSVLRVDATETTGSIGNSAPGAGLTIGNGIAAQTHSPIDVAEVGSFSAALDLTQRDTLVAYLQDLYNL